ncbi:MAG TPA: HXXEE domain-containing protein [Thermoanaerobaculia bacterium]
MSRTGRIAFLALILAQAAHSIEEYANRLYDVLAPARFVSGLFSSDLRIGFVIVNVLLVAFGLGCFFGPVLRGARSAVALAWFWVVLEFLNGCAHITWAASAGAYRPGLATAPVLVTIAAVLGWEMGRRIQAPDSLS